MSSAFPELEPVFDDDPLDSEEGPDVGRPDYSDDESPYRGEISASEALADPFAIQARRRPVPVIPAIDMERFYIGKRKLSANVIEAILDAEITRQLDGESTLIITLSDPDGNVRKSKLIAGTVNASLDGRDYRLTAVRKEGTALILTFSTRGIALLKLKYGFKRAWRRTHKGGKGVTRAEFVLSLIREIKTLRIPTVIPELHKVRPIGKYKTTPKRRSRGRDKGIAGGEINIKGIAIDDKQKEHVERALATADAIGNVPHRAYLALLVAGIGESAWRPVVNDLGYGGVLQGQVRTGGHYFTVDDTEAETRSFLRGGKGYGAGGAIHLANTTKLNPGEIATKVEVSGQPGSFYQRYIEEAKKLLADWGGGSSGHTQTYTRTKKYAFIREKNVNSWDTILGLAQQDSDGAGTPIGWRAFFVDNTFYFISEQQLFKSMSRMTIREYQGGVDTIDYEYDRGHPVADMTVSCRGSRWVAPPGSVVTVADVAPQVDGKWLVDTCHRKLGETAMTITLKKPQAEMPEPAPDVEKQETSSGEDWAGPGSAATPKQLIDDTVLPIARNAGIDITPEQVEQANARHGPTVSGGASDHQGPPEKAWAADMSNGSHPTREMDKLARDLAKEFNIPWSGAGLVSKETKEWKFQLIYRTHEGGNHFNHVHFGARLKEPRGPGRGSGGPYGTGRIEDTGQYS